MVKNDKKRDPRAASATDKTIGARIRARRGELKMSQERLAEMIGVTFQQIQKYEKGVNRVSASTLMAIARALELRISALYPQNADSGDKTATLNLDAPELAQFASLVTRLNSEGQALLLDLAHVLAAQKSLQAK